MKSYIKEFFQILDEKPELDKQGIAKLKIVLCKKYPSVRKIPTDIEILLNASEADAKKYRLRLQTKPGRTLSGVSPVAVMTSPAICPHGKCTMCPGGLKSPWGDKPQSYTGGEPATMRGERAGYDAYLQVFNRLEQYMVTGHVADKVDLIIMGGTFTAREKEYQDKFIKDCLQAMNDFSELFFVKGEFSLDAFRTFFELPADIHAEGRTEKIQKKILQFKHRKQETSLVEEQKKNETTIIRCIGMTIETRPDWGFAKEGNIMLEQGCTRVELGIQSVYDDSLELIKRGHTVADNKKSIRELKDLGFKLNFHIMLGLPSTSGELRAVNSEEELQNEKLETVVVSGRKVYDRMSKEKDLKGLLTLFSDPDFRPDMLKLYPLMVMPGTLLYQDWQKGLFHPLSTEDAADIISDFLPQVEPYCRVMRVQRDIPSSRVIAGVDKTNLRQYVDRAMLAKKLKSRDIRARETGRNTLVKDSVFELKVQEYTASKGTEFFISMEDVKNDTIAGFCRLRFPSQQLHDEITPTTAIIRELHVYGAATKIGSGSETETTSQHKGFGKKLVAKAEEICKERGYDNLLVISGIGVKEYYRTLDYSDVGSYVGKKL